MRGRWASAALGAGVARRRAGREMDQQASQYEAQQQDAQRTIEAQAKTNRCNATTKATTAITTGRPYS